MQAFDIHDTKKLLSVADDERRVKLFTLPGFSEIAELRTLFDISEVKFSREGDLIGILSQ